MNKILLFLLFNLIAVPAYAYIGPGMGGGIIAVTLGIILAIFIAIFGIIYFPIKRFLKNRNKKSDNKEKN